MSTTPTPTPVHQQPTALPGRTPVLIRVAAAILALLWLTMGGLGGPKIGQLSGLQENDSTAFLAANAESSLAADEASAFSDGDTLPLFIVLTKDSGLDAEDLSAIGAFVADLPSLPLGDDLTLSDVAVEDPAAVIPSEDGEAVLIPIALNASRASEDIGETSTIRVVMDAVDSAASADLASRGIDVAQTGPAAYVADFSTAFAGIDGVLLLVALAVVFVILVLVYRSPFLPFVVLAAAVLGLSAAGFIVYELVSRGYLSVSGQSQGILSILVVGAATDYALLIVSRFREELHHTPSSWVAMKRTWRGTVEPITASAVTVIAGLLCLLLSDLGSTRSLGPISAAGIVGALLGALTFLPAVLVLTGRRIFWPRIPRFDAATAQTPTPATGLWATIATFVGRHARAVWISASILLIAAAALAPTFRADGLGNNEVFRVDVPSVTGEAVLTEHFPAGAATPVTVVVPTGEASAVIDAANQTPGVQEASLLLEAGPPPGTPGAPAPEPVTVDDRVLVEITVDAEGDSLAAQDTVAALRTAIHDVDPDLHVGGQAAQALDTRLANERDLRTVLPAIVGVVFIVLILLLRSLVAPIILIVANVLSFLATIGVSALVFNHVLDFPNSDPSTPIYAFVFLIALGVDYSIFLMTRIREDVPTLGARPAVVHGLAVTGGVITSAGLVLAATFAALFIIPLVFMAQIAFMVAFGVLLDTFVVRALLVSGLAYDLGRGIWWPSRLGRHQPQRLE